MKSKNSGKRLLALEKMEFERSWLVLTMTEGKKVLTIVLAHSLFFSVGNW